MTAAPASFECARTSLVAPALLALLGSACGGATPLLHPAHTLAPGKVSFGAGASGTFLAGQAKGSLDDARAVTASGSAISDEEKQRLAEGTMTSVLATPGLAPWVGGRVGVAEHADAGAAYTGRWARIDGRYALENRKFALSFGLGALALLSHPTSDPAEPAGTSGQIAGVDASGAYGFGFHVPVLVGYRSDAELVQTWGGVVGTFEQALGTVVLADESPDIPNESPAPNDDVTDAKLDAHRFSGAVVVGLAVGIEPIWVAVELTGRYFALDGSLSSPDGRTSSDLTGLSIEPAGALIGRF